MKKITLLFVILFAFCWHSNAQFTESFETGIPATWTILDLSSGTSWVSENAPEGGAQDGSSIAQIGSEPDTPNDDYLITPQITVTAGVNDRLSFYVKSRLNPFLESYEVLLSTTTADASDFTEVLQVSSDAPPSWTKLTFDLSAYVGQSIYVAVRATSQDEYYFFVDNFNNDTFPTCVEPEDLAATNITTSAANLSWTGTAVSWNIEIVDITAGETVTSNPTDTGVTNPYTATSLAPNNDYEFYVQADCGVDGSSIWVGPYSFTTVCTAFMAPYTENFENNGVIPDCWQMSGGEEWFFETDGFGYVGTEGTLSGSTDSNGYFAAVDASGNHGPRYLLSPFVDVGTLAIPDLRFYEISDSEGSGNGQLDVEVWDGAVWNLMATYNTNTINNAWELKTVDISGLTFTGPAQARFTFSEPNGGSFDDIAIDDVTFDEAITCDPPTALTVTSITTSTANLAWTGTAVSWNIEVVDVTAGETVTGIPTETDVTNPYMLTSLLANHDYEFYVQADCGAVDGTSIWETISFTTACDVFTAPYTEDFENFGSIPDCWRMSSDSEEEDWFFEISGLSHVGDGGTLSGSTASGSTYAAADASGEHGPRYLLSPLVDVSTLTTPALSFYEISNSEDSSNAQLDVEVWDGTTWNLMATYNTNTVNGAWELKTIDISGLSFTGPAQARFTYSEILAPGDHDDDIAIDDVTFDEAPTCASPSTIIGTNITTTTADIEWIGTATSWNIEVVDITAGETVTGIATETGVSNPYTLTGLVDDNAYDFYVQADCGVDGVSIWVGPYSFSSAIIPAGCGDNFVDTGGTVGSYSNSEFTSTTILPDSAGEKVTITFTHVDIEVDTAGEGEQDGCYDYLTIYNGPDNTYPVLAQTLCGEDSGSGDNTIVASSELHVGDFYTSTDVSGALTIEFNSDSSEVRTGWEATISCDVLGVDDVVNEPTFTYYPNPVKNSLTLNAQKNIEDVTIYNMLGQEVLKASPNYIASELDVSGLNTGTYFVKVTIEAVTKTIRVIKQ